MTYRAGDKVKVVNADPVGSGGYYDNGDIFEVKSVEDGVIETTSLATKQHYDGGIQLYTEEVVPYEEDFDIAEELATSLTQAIADKVEADGDIPSASMTIQLDGKSIAETLFSYIHKPGHPHAIKRIEPGPERPADYELTEEDREWLEMESVGKEVIYDDYNPDNVEHPSHYTQGKFETIEIIAQTVSGYDDGFTAHCVGTATKYLNRAPFKHESPLEDLKKAAKYLEFAIEHEEKKRK